MPNEFNTLEAAQAEIIRLNELLTERTNERDTLSQNNAALTQELQSVRQLNQQYFNKLSAQYSPEADENDDGDEEVPTCEEFGKSLTIL